MLKEKSGVVSIWLGIIPRVSVLNNYLKETYSDDEDAPISRFAVDLNQSFYDHDSLEAIHCRGKGKLINDLLADSSYANSFLEKSVSLANKSGVKKANAAILFYDHILTTKKWPESSPFTFIGSPPYSRKTIIAEQPVADIRGHTGGVSEIAFTPDGKHCVTGGDDGTLIVWDLKTGLALTPPRAIGEDATDSIYFIGFGAGGKRCVASTLFKTGVWDDFPDTRKKIRMIKESCSSMSPDGHVGVRYEEAYDLTTGKQWKHQFSGESEAFAVLDNQMILYSTLDQKIVCWNFKTAKTVWSCESKHGSPYGELAISPKRTLAATCRDQFVTTWDLKLGKAKAEIKHNNDRVRKPLFCGEKTIAVIDYKGLVQTYSALSGKRLKTFQRPKTKYSSGELSVSENGKRLSFVDKKYRLVDVWNVRDGKFIRRFSTSEVKSKPGIKNACLAPDGNTLVVGEFSGKVHFVRVHTSKN